MEKISKNLSDCLIVERKSMDLDLISMVIPEMYTTLF